MQRTATRTVDNTVPVRELARSCRRLTVKISTDELNMKRGTVRLILAEELGIRKICAKMSPRNLAQQERHACLSVCADLLEQVVADPELMDRVITVDVSWFFPYDPETKHQCLEWRSKRSPRPRKHACPSQK